VDYTAYRLVSLWKMLKPYASIYRHASDLCREYTTQLDKLTGERGGHHTLIGDCVEQLRHELTILIAHAGYVGLTHTIAAAVEARSSLRADTPISRVQAMMMDVWNSLRRELSHKEFLYVDDKVAHFYSSPLTGWEDVADKIPGVVFDVSEAGKCLALGRATACVFHLMRVAELGLRDLARHLKVKLPKKLPIADAEWQAILQGIDDKLATLRNQPKAKPGRNAAITSYSEIRLEFAAIKDVWRNHVAHARATYDEHQALSAYGHVQALMQRLPTGARQ
jgi:hypothetical protein